MRGNGKLTDSSIYLIHQDWNFNGRKTNSEEVGYHF